MASFSRAPQSVRFGLFEADLAGNELRKNGRRIKLQEQPFQVLALLVQHAGEVVPREELQKTLWPGDTFVEFDQGVNTAIQKIRRALGDSAENRRFIETLPRKGYRFIAPLAASEATVPNLGPADIGSRRRSRSLWILVLSAIVAMGVLAGWLIATRKTRRDVPLTAVPLTSYAGQEVAASFSPDGNQVAFVWNGEKQDNFDIYVKLIGSDWPLRITSNPAPDFSPAWSPDGRWIAFLRAIDPKHAAVLLAPAIGGAERKVAEIGCCTKGGTSLSWSPDGKWLAAEDATYSEAAPALSCSRPKTALSES